MTNWQRLVLLVAILLVSPAELQARVVITDTANSFAASENQQFKADSISVQGAADPPKSVRSLAAVAPKRVSSQIQFGLQRLHGLQGPKDLKQAGMAFMLAYSRADLQAPAAVALCTLMGCYGASDRRSVALWIERTRVREPAKAKLLEWASAEQFGDPQLRSRSAALLREAAALQDPVALNEQGLQQLAAGQRLAAFKSFELAAQKGSPAASRNFELLMQQPENRAEAAERSGVATPGKSFYEQAKRYHLGLGIPINDVQAVELYRQAANVGHLQARRMLELIVSRLNAQGQPDTAWMRVLAERQSGVNSLETQATAIWPQKDISLLADWFPVE